MTLGTLGAQGIRTRTHVRNVTAGMGRHATMEGGERVKEREVEAYLVRRARKLSGVAVKFTSPGHSGVPDRVVVLPGGRVGFLELKAPGRKPGPEQEYWIRQLRGLGCLAGVADSLEGVDAFLGSLAGTKGTDEGTEGRP